MDDDLHVVEDLDVYIKVDGQRLDEYDDEDEESFPHIRTKYVAAQSGADFSVAYDLDEYFSYRTYDLSLSIFLDGKKAFSIIHYGDKFHLRKAQEFTFSDLAVEEEGENLNADQQKSVTALGEITVKLWRVQVTSESRVPTAGKWENDLDQISKVPEKALKGRAVSHRTKLGQAQAGKAFNEVSVTYLDPIAKPFTVYNFRYRSLEALKSMRLIPQTPEPVPLEDRPIEDLSPEQMRELLRLQKEQLEQGGSVKRESRSETVPPKREPEYRSQWEDGDDIEVIETRPAKRRRNSDDPVETVDLTGD
ncbi:hypothetical protein IWX90DRAFT_483689 [Phyllosticta citrichinensis]|uniref:DUF7918 domain-containing protein n=1 Tax=Phyllosticta citrichinensis TaxID=1130410 RepID=A0ABR1Y3A6_9PEZI